MPEKNALAELAERMFKEVDGRRLIEPNREDYCKAQRIVAELARVSDGDWVEDCGGMFYLCCADSRVVETSVGKCRAIAEEGAGDGK